MKSKLFLTALVLGNFLSMQPCFADDSAWKNPAMPIGVCAGFLFGTPVCMARRFVHDEVQGTRGIAGETNNKLLLVPAGAFWLPFAAISSFCEGPVYAFRNSYMADKPFSKEQFSLGDMPEYDSSEVLKSD